MARQHKVNSVTFLLFLLVSEALAWSPELRTKQRNVLKASCRRGVNNDWSRRRWSPGLGRREHIALKARRDDADDSDDSSRRHFVTSSAMAAASFTSNSQPAIAMNPKSRSKGYEVQKTDAEWKSMLSPTQYDILRLGGTERPYSSILESEKRNGIFVCAGCGTKLFASDQKFKSGTGWPSFARALEGVETENVNAVTANMVGAELRCSTCGGHLGDVFQDGFLFPGTPAFTSGKRYCIDGAALVFEPANGEATVAGDLSPPPKQEPDWMSPPKIIPRETA